MKWTEEETVKFVGLYLENECLWNMRIPSYKNKSLRQKALESLVGDMKKEGFGLAEAKQKIKNLRSTYNQELLKIKKSKKSGSGLIDVYVPTLKWFSTFDIIMKSYKVKGDTIANIADEEFDDEATGQAMTVNDDDDVVMSESILCSDNTNIETESHPHVPIPASAKPSLPISGLTNNTRSKTKRKFQEISNAVKDLKAMSVHLNPPAEQDISDHEIFGKHVAKCLEALGPLHATLAQQEIQNILTNYKVKMLLENENNTEMLKQVDNEIEEYIVIEENSISDTADQ